MDADCQILRHVDETAFQNAGHVVRLTEEEELDTYVFLNNDGTKTVYYMAEEVKYIDADGTVKEKNLDLVATAQGYGITQSDIGLLIPNDPANGITMDYGGYSVSLVPQGDMITSAPQVSDNTVMYPNYYGKGTILRYTPTLSGIKEDIILASYTGTHAFTFLLNTDGLRVFESEGRYYLSTSTDAELRIWLGEILVYDAMGRPDAGTMTVETVAEGRQYRLTIAADPAFLTDPETVYPVTIDPTLTVSDNTHGAGAIEDAGIFSNKTTTNTGKWVYNHCGYYDSSYGIGRVVVRLTGAISDFKTYGLSASQINSVKYYMKEATGTAASAVNVHALTSNSTWTETGVTWSNVGSYSTTVYASASPAYNAVACFDITSLARAWLSAAINANCGFILIGANESTVDKNFYTSEHSNTAYRPYVEVNYTFDGIYFSSTAIDASIGSSLKRTPHNSSNLSLSWISSNPDVATVNSTGTVSCLHAGSSVITASATVGGETYSASYTVYVRFSDGIYHISNIVSGYRLGVYGGKIANGTNVEQQFQYANEQMLLRQMWRIKYFGYGVYSIRPMHKLDMGLDVTSGNVDIRKIGTGDTSAELTDNMRWTIEYDTNGYIFRLNNYSGGSNYSMLVTGASTTSRANVAYAVCPSGQYHNRWTLSNISSPPSGVLIYNTSTGSLLNGATLQTTLTGDSTVTPAVYSPTSLSQSVTLSSSDTVVATIDNNGDIIKYLPGITTITCSTPSSSASFNLSVFSDITLAALSENGVIRDAYFIQSIPLFEKLSTNQCAFSFTQVTPSRAIEWMQNTSIYYVHTHGESDGIYCGSEFITLDMLKTVDLSNMEFALLLTCLTGYGGY